ncbi:hypothetical protein [Chromohalobacter sp. HP20-39]|uniref:hypothetical protein n=1 Tax=Chromohalobacter sp. HP20-39 TaxID=3079306 RepID=UPI0039825ED0
MSHQLQRQPLAEQGMLGFIRWRIKPLLERQPDAFGQGQAPRLTGGGVEQFSQRRSQACVRRTCGFQQGEVDRAQPLPTGMTRTQRLMTGVREHQRFTRSQGEMLPTVR